MLRYIGNVQRGIIINTMLWDKNDGSRDAIIKYFTINICVDCEVMTQKAHKQNTSSNPKQSAYYDLPSGNFYLN